MESAKVYLDEADIEEVRLQENVQEMRRPQFVSVVVYVHNNGKKIKDFAETVMNCFQKNFKQCEVIFVDDYSSDGSRQTIKEYYKSNPVNYIVNIIQMGCYHGLEIAMNAGRDMAIGDYVYEFDNMYVDYNADVIIEAYNKCLEGYDIVSVSADVSVRFTSRLFYGLFNSVSNLQTKISQDSWRLISRRGVNRIVAMDVDIPYRKAVYFNSGLSVAQISYKSQTGSRPPRITGRYERLKLGVESFIYFTSLVERIAMVAAILFSIFTICLIGYSFFAGLFSTGQGPGNRLVIFIMSIGFMGVFCLLAVIMKYLSVLVDLVFKRKKYRIAGVEKISLK